jgi:hypothetical protein
VIVHDETDSGKTTQPPRSIAAGQTEHGSSGTPNRDVSRALFAAPSGENDGGQSGRLQIALC